MFSVYIFEFGHLQSHSAFSHPLEDLVKEAKHMGQTEIESVVFSREIVLGIRLLVLPDVELRILNHTRITTMVNIAPRLP